MQVKGPKLNQKLFRSPPPRPNTGQEASRVEASPATPVDHLDEAAPKEDKGFQFHAFALQLGLAANTLTGGAAAQAAPAEIATELTAQASSAIDLAVESDAVLQSWREDKQGFVKREFTIEQARASLDLFSHRGELLLSGTRNKNSTLTPEAALRRLQSKQISDVRIKMPNGQTYQVHNLADLQELDTFLGTGESPVVHPEVLEALQALTRGEGEEDGLFREGSMLLKGQRLDAFRAYKYLTEGDPRGGQAAVHGAGYGLLAAGAGVALATGAGLMVPGAAAVMASGGAALAVASGALVAGTVGGAAIGYQVFKHRDNFELAIRQGVDRGLKIRNLEHAVETHHWLQARADRPFTEEQQGAAALHFSGQSGLYRKGREITAEAALTLLKEGKAVEVPSTIPNHSDTLHNLRDLQILDTIRGLSLNPVLPAELSQSLRYLESGRQPDDGLYVQRVVARGRGSTTHLENRERMSAFEAVDYLFRDRKPIGVALDGKTYRTETLADIQELNALKGDGVNTILPQQQFDSLRMFDGRERLYHGNKRVQIDAFEALQAIQSGASVRVLSMDRKAKVESLEDFHELDSLEFGRRNEILGDNEYKLLQHWEENGAYRVDNDGEADHAYEALQAIQSDREFEVRSAGRYAPAEHFLDLQDLATFETPEAGFPNAVPHEPFDRLMYFQGANEGLGQATTRVGHREGRAYEGYRALRDGKSFHVAAGGEWNTVTDLDSLHDLDAMLGRQVNDILPQEQYDLLKLLADEPQGEGLHKGETRVNSYAALQEFRAGRGLSYDFNGGDFGYRLHIDTPSLQSLDETRELRDNQKDYDQYAYTVAEWRDKMQRQAEHTPGLAGDNLDYGQAELREGQSDLRRGNSNLAGARSDLRSAEWDLSRAESELRRARAMPRYKYDREYKCDYDGDCAWETVQNYNHQRDWAISRARSHVRSAESDIRGAERDIRAAEALISRANRDIRTARGLISDAETLIDGLPSYRQLMDGTVDQNYAERVEQLKSRLAAMKNNSHISSLDSNLGRQQRLIQNMESRPARPEGWQVPDKLVQR